VSSSPPLSRSKVSSKGKSRAMDIDDNDVPADDGHYKMGGTGDSDMEAENIRYM